MATYRFGAFELDTLVGELHSGGRYTPLRPQPAAVLEHLVLNAGRLVTRAELRRVLWPHGTYVQFDHGLNSCIKQIRGALGDSRTSPVYLETLTRRGYRFVAEVHRIDEPDDPSSFCLLIPCSPVPIVLFWQSAPQEQGVAPPVAAVARPRARV